MSESTTPRVAIVIPARDAARTLPRLLDALPARNASPPAEVIAIDNGSLDATAAIAAGHPRVDRVIRRPRGEGPGAARNAGAAAACAEQLAFIDADCRPAPGWLAAGCAALGEADLVQGRVVPDPAVAPIAFDRTLAVEGLTGLFESANLFVLRDVFERVGGFPDGLEAGLPGGGGPFGEDVRFGWRAVRAGARPAFCAAALVHHGVERRTGRAYAVERLRRAGFPALVAEVPELRDALLHRRWFLSPRTARFDVLLAGLAVAAARGRPGPRLLAAVASAPYLAEVVRVGRRWGPRAAAWELAADTVSAVALGAGSLRAATLVA